MLTFVYRPKLPGGTSHARLGDPENHISPNYCNDLEPSRDVLIRFGFTVVQGVWAINRVGFCAVKISQAAPITTAVCLNVPRSLGRHFICTYVVIFSD